MKFNDITYEITIRGQVHKHEGNDGECFKSGIRPNIKTRDGLVASAIILDDPSIEITSSPTKCTLCFFYPVDIDLCVGEIELYAASKLIMKFIPNKLVENSFA